MVQEGIQESTQEEVIKRNKTYPWYKQHLLDLKEKRKRE